jgi:hypothetical protein
MTKNASTATKAGLKNTKPGKRGGARPGAGRKAKEGDFQQLHIDTPDVLLKGMEKAGIKNKTAYVLYLVATDLQTHAKMPKKILAECEYIAESLRKNH